jgi:hypothetical protein
LYGHLAGTIQKVQKIEENAGKENQGFTLTS